MAHRADWLAAQDGGQYGGSPDDRRDGFIHFSTAAQVARSAHKHRAGQPDLLLLHVDPAQLGAALRWEASGSGETFPHLYATLPVDVVARVDPLPLGPDGLHVFPRLATGV
ncbi:MAG: DUF952 domain-containing protein [bacterium]|nr:DUF952 domain-containing protein [bacterium]